MVYYFSVKVIGLDYEAVAAGRDSIASGDIDYMVIRYKVKNLVE